MNWNDSGFLLSKNKYNAIVFEWSDVTKWNIDGRIMNYAKKYNVKTLCLPHGCSIFLNKNVNEAIKKMLHPTILFNFLN